MGQGVFRLQQGHGSTSLVIPVEAMIRPADRRQVLFPVPQKIPSLLQLLVLAGTQFSPLQLVNLKMEAVHLPSFFRLVHPQSVHAPAQFRHGIINAPVLVQGAFQPTKTVQICAVLFLVQKLLTVVLTVDVQKVCPQCPQLGHRDRPTVDAAEILSVSVDLALDHQKPVLIRLCTAFRKAWKITGHTGKLRADHRFFAAGADQIPRGPTPQHRAHSIDYDGLARASFAGQGVEARTELNIRLLDHRNILNVQQFQHDPDPLFSFCR